MPAVSGFGESGPRMSPVSQGGDEGPGTSWDGDRDPGQPGRVKGIYKDPCPCRKRMCQSRPPLASKKSLENSRSVVASRWMPFSPLITFIFWNNFLFTEKLQRKYRVHVNPSPYTATFT